jgi:hypothetical protein
MGFWRQQEEKLARHLLERKYQQQRQAVPPEEELVTMSKSIVAQAHRIARQRGRNVWSIIKDLASSIKQN